MRNLRDYPIKPQEVLDGLEQAGRLMGEHDPFNVYGLTLHTMTQWLMDHPDALEDITGLANDWAR